MACGSPVSASGSGLEGLGEPVGAALPGIRGGRRVERRAIVSKEAVGGARIDDDLHVPIVLLDQFALLAGGVRGGTLVLFAKEPEQRDLDVLGQVEARAGRGLIGVRARGWAVPRHGRLHVWIGGRDLEDGRAAPAPAGDARAVGA